MEKEHGPKFAEKKIVTDPTMSCYNYSSSATPPKKPIKASKVAKHKEDKKKAEEKYEGEQPVSPSESMLVKNLLMSI